MFALSLVMLLVEFEVERMGWSLRMERRVSAATMPPMLWPIRSVRTEGSMVGLGVEAATSRSMTLFWSLYPYVLSSEWGRERRDSAIPFFEARDTFMQVAAGLEFGVLNLDYIHFRERMIEEGAQMRWKLRERVIAALSMVYQLSLL